jgi:hypothetical protein
MQPNETLDLDAFDDAQSATVILKNPATGAPTAASIDVLGPEHPVRKKIMMDRARKLRSDFQRTGKLSMNDPLDDIDDETDFLVASTTGWTGLTSNGQALAYSADESRRLYTNPKKQWLRAQVKKALDEAERFIQSSAKA